MARMLFQGHGSYRIAANDGTVLYVDPFAGEGYDLPADVIVVTHEHPDHNAVDKMPHADSCTILRAGDFQPEPGEYRTIEAGPFRLTGVQAYNKNHPAESCVGVIIEVDGVSFYAAGDTSTTEDMTSGKLAALGLDYATFPSDGFYNMDVDEASACAKLVAAAHSIPMHNSAVHDPHAAPQLLDLDRAAAFAGPGKLVVEPGEEIELVPAGA